MSAIERTIPQIKILWDCESEVSVDSADKERAGISARRKLG